MKRMQAPPTPPMIYLTADTHFFHKNIAKYCERPDGWQDDILSHWSKLKDDDIVFHLGDLIFGNRLSEISQYLKGIKFLLKGNHDRLSNQRYIEAGFTIMKSPFVVGYITPIVLSHRPIYSPINLHGHTHKASDIGVDVGWDVWGRFLELGEAVSYLHLR